MVFVEAILGIVVILLVYVYWKSARPPNYPPGPPRIPFLGNLHNLSDEPAKDFMRLRKQYGDIFAIDFGPYPAIVLNSIQLVKESFAEHAFSGRPQFKPFLERSGGKPGGIIFHDGSGWVEQRRFTLKHLRDFGFGRKSMETLVQDEIKELIETFKKSADTGKPISTQNQFNAAVLNALWSIVSGNRYSHSDEILGTLIEQLTSTIKQSKALGITLFFPFLRQILPAYFLGGLDLKERRKRAGRVANFMKETIQSHKETFQPNQPRDFIDVYLQEIANTENPTSSFHVSDGERNLITVMNDLFVAGAETTSTTLTWAFLLLAINQTEQQKLAEEILKTVESSRLPSLSDRPAMPYTEAVIMEVLRYSALTPMAVQHRTTEATTIGGYSIPTDTLVISNQYGILHDEEIWGDPETFRPERFLSADGSKVIRHEAFIPFSTGKRVCLGESLARDELFLFMASLFQRFKVEPDPNSPELKPEYHAAPVLIPKPHLLILTDRFEEIHHKS